MSDVIVYKLDTKGWAVALNPKSDCKIWHFPSKKRAIEKAKELEAVNE
jgi:hypothetical protein